MEGKSVSAFTEPVELKWYTVFILLFGVRHTYIRNRCFQTQRKQARRFAIDLMVPVFMTLNSIPEACQEVVHAGAPLAGQLFTAITESCMSCVLGMDALRSTLNAASTVTKTLSRLLKIRGFINNTYNVFD